MAEQLYHIELTASFLERLASIEMFLEEADAAFAYDDLLAGLRSTVIPNLARFALIGKRYLEQPPQSAEALVQLERLPAGAANGLRVYLQRLSHSVRSGCGQANSLPAFLSSPSSAVI